MRMYDIIENKKNNKSLTKEEIDFFVNGFTAGEIPDYQMSALLMAIVLNGMNEEETTNLTLAMASSGEKLDLSEINGNTVDKHSTGGVGDKTTLIVAPIVACLNCKVAKMSGRALGHTGGTVDKLESIKGFKTQLSKEDFIKQVNEIGISVISQTEDIAKADKKIYALRDVTATVESIPLIASSIMSKKIASGAKNLVLDVKVGNGAFMKNLEEAKKLGTLMVKIGRLCGLNVAVLLTNMNIPLGNNIGNIKEIEEAVDVLNNKGPNDLKEVCIYLATYMNSITNNISVEESRKQVIEVLESGKAYEKFCEFIKYQGGNLDTFEKPKYSYPVYSKVSGYITNMDTTGIGKISVKLGAGRTSKDDIIDYTAGIVLNKKTNDYVKENELLATLYTSKEVMGLEEEYLTCLQFDEEKPNSESLIYGVIK